PPPGVRRRDRCDPAARPHRRAASSQRGLADHLRGAVRGLGGAGGLRSLRLAVVAVVGSRPRPGRRHPVVDQRVVPPQDRRTGQPMSATVQLTDIRKVYATGPSAVTALAGVTYGFVAGTFTAVMGPSGSGKSTLLHCAA